ncbi:uncharacterized protein LOC123267112 [Cotesia glomerata]|uniref:Uncharacterized protein n=1 Tax=Cotesia glomerata TaxID=32391 RepID=A0AAV7HWB6_COTGL|nr:uncharacterized protein LOC123267112 [Cotesia glomerata]XP_044587560.1 uncharacterized protein LOC123267112 [Cotesia glomerata]KAH0534319.1 hypothetical protein KQX54_003055 [Cotesia glomerata]
MDLKYLGIFVAILMVDSSAAEVDPTIAIKFKKLEATTVDNPFFEELTTEISKSELEGTAKFAIKQSLTPTMKISLTAERLGQQVAEFEDDICELMKNEIYGKELIKYGLPKDKFPKDCPVTPGDYEIREYPLPKDKFPTETPPGVYFMKMLIGEPEQDPFVSIDIIIDIVHEAPNGVPVPALPSPKLG